jgi:hypothetical protein
MTTLHRSSQMWTKTQHVSLRAHGAVVDRKRWATLVVYKSTFVSPHEVRIF